MKVEFYESSYGINITLMPDNITESMKLLRYANNAKREKPGVYFNFKFTPELTISLKKVNESVQKNSISKY